MDELNGRRAVFAYNMFKFKPLKYCKIMNMNISGLYLNGLVACAERVCFKNVVFQNINKDVTKSECRYLTMKSCANLQHLDHTKFFHCEQANLVRCEILRDNLKIFKDKLKILTIRRTFSVDGIVAKYLAFDSPFSKLVVLDLSYNQIEFNGLVFLLHKGAVFANTLKKMSLERNLVINSFFSIISRLQLPVIEYLDLNLNQIEWDEDEVKSKGYRIVRKLREKKQVNDRYVKVRAVEIALDSDLIIKVMSPEDLYKD